MVQLFCLVIAVILIHVRSISIDYILIFRFTTILKEMQYNKIFFVINSYFQPIASAPTEIRRITRVTLGNHNIVSLFPEKPEEWKKIVVGELAITFNGRDATEYEKSLLRKLVETENIEIEKVHLDGEPADFMAGMEINCGNVLVENIQSNVDVTTLFKNISKLSLGGKMSSEALEFFKLLKGISFVDLSGLEEESLFPFVTELNNFIDCNPIVDFIAPLSVMKHQEFTRTTLMQLKKKPATLSLKARKGEGQGAAQGDITGNDLNSALAQYFRPSRLSSVKFSFASE